ncbi:MAG TPA: glycosyltransferase family 4 protein [Vulgatibacter sp.]
MRVWLTQTSEPYPFLEGAARMRTANLAAELHRRGHEVVWWGGNIEHRRKQPLAAGVYEVAPGYEVRLLEAPHYARNVSLRRYRSYKVLAREFAREARTLPPPDVVVAGLPIHDLAWAAVRYSSERGIPSLVDVRDLWPDYFVELLPRGLRALGRAALAGDFRRKHEALSQATGVIGISRTYLEWGLAAAGRAAREADAVFFLGGNALDGNALSGKALGGNALDTAARGSGATSAGATSVQPGDDAAGVVASEGPSKSREIVFGFLGVFGHTYDLETVIEAARILHRAGETRARFALAGTGDFFERVSKAAEGLPNVTLPGWLDKAGVDAFLRRLDVGLAAYAAGAPQSLPNKPFQYFAAGAPVLSSLHGEFGELLTSTQSGLTYRAGDPASLVAAVRSLLDDPARIPEMGARGAALFHSTFDASVIYPLFADHLEQVAAAAPRKALRGAA